MSDKNDTGHYEGVLAEEVRDELKAIRESLAPLASMPGDVAQLKDDVSQLKTDVATIKLVVTDQSSQLKDHEGRINKLEQVD